MRLAAGGVSTRTPVRDPPSWAQQRSSTNGWATTNVAGCPLRLLRETRMRHGHHPEISVRQPRRQKRNCLFGNELRDDAGRTGATVEFVRRRLGSDATYADSLVRRRNVGPNSSPHETPCRRASAFALRMRRLAQSIKRAGSEDLINWRGELCRNRGGAHGTRLPLIFTMTPTQASGSDALPMCKH